MLKDKKPLVAIIILNWNGWRDTIDCLKSLQKINYNNYYTVIIDNGSTDNSVQIIRTQLHKAYYNSIENINLRNGSIDETNINRATVYSKRKDGNSDCTALLELNCNLGFSEGNNIGLDFAFSSGFNYALLLNNDTIVDREFLIKLVKSAVESKASVIGALPRRFSDNRVLFWKKSYPYALFFNEPHWRVSGAPDWWETFRVDGCAMLLERDFLIDRFDSLGYFLDSSLFLYHEEAELGLWCRQKNLKSIIVPNSIVYHKVGRSSGKSGFYYQTRNRILVARRYLPIYLLVPFFLYIPLRRIVRIFLLIITGRPNLGMDVLEGLCDGLRGRSGRKKGKKYFS